MLSVHPFLCGGQTLAFQPGQSPETPAHATVEHINVNGDGWASRVQPGGIVFVASPDAIDNAAVNAVREQLSKAASPFACVMHAPCPPAVAMAQVLRGNSDVPMRVMGDAATALDVVDSSASQGITLVIAPPGGVTRAITQVLLATASPAPSHSFRLQAYGVSVLNRTAPGIPWPMFATVINDVRH
jgi:hypothetical protein